MPHMHDCYFEPGFRFYYGDHIYAEKSSLANTLLMDYGRITIGAGTMISKDCKIVTTKHEVGNIHNIVVESVSIGKNVFIGVNTLILSGVTIGDNCFIGAGSVVTHDIPANYLAAGNPAKCIRKVRPHYARHT